MHSAEDVNQLLNNNSDFNNQYNHQNKEQNRQCQQSDSRVKNPVRNQDRHAAAAQALLRSCAERTLQYRTSATRRQHQPAPGGRLQPRGSTGAVLCLARWALSGSAYMGRQQSFTSGRHHLVGTAASCYRYRQRGAYCSTSFLSPGGSSEQILAPHLAWAETELQYRISRQQRAWHCACALQARPWHVSWLQPLLRAAVSVQLT